METGTRTLDEAIQDAVMNRAVELSVEHFKDHESVDLSRHVEQATREVRQIVGHYGRMMSLIKVELSRPEMAHYPLCLPDDETR